MTSQDWKTLTPADGLADDAVYEEWLAKPSWSLLEAALLINGLHPVRAKLQWKGFPVKEQSKIIDTLRRAIGARGKHGLVPMSGKNDGDWQFEPRAIIRNAVYYGLEVSDLLLERAKVAETPPESSHGNAIRYARKREEVLMVAMAALAYRPQEFRSNQGRLVVKHLAEYLEEYWPGNHPPYQSESMEQLIGKGLRFGKWTDTKSTENI